MFDSSGMDGDEQRDPDNSNDSTAAMSSLAEDGETSLLATNQNNRGNQDMFLDDDLDAIFDDGDEGGDGGGRGGDERRSSRERPGSAEADEGASSSQGNPREDAQAQRVESSSSRGSREDHSDANANRGTSHGVRSPEVSSTSPASLLFPLTLSSIQPISLYARGRRRSGAHGEGRGRRSFPPPTWQNEEADMTHRQTMILEIARLLRSRKKTQPSQEWLRQLPYKSRKLEERLYRSAPMREAYLDLSTLKNRLKTLARDIMQLYREAKKNHRHSDSRSSVSSRSSFGSFSSQFSQHSHLSFTGENRRSISSLQEEDAEVGSNSSRGSAAAAAAAEGAKAGCQLLQLAGSVPDSLASADQQMQSESSNESTVKRPSALTLESQIQQQSSPNTGNPSSGSLPEEGRSISELEQQKAVNAQLQEQILDNLRKLQSRGQGAEVQGQMSSAQATIHGNMMNSVHPNGLTAHAFGAIGGTAVPPSLLASQMNCAGNHAPVLMRNGPPSTASQAQMQLAVQNMSISNQFGRLGGDSNNPGTATAQSASQHGGATADHQLATSISAHQQLSLLRNNPVMGGSPAMAPLFAAQTMPTMGGVVARSGGGGGEGAGFNSSMPPPNSIHHTQVPGTNQQENAGTSINVGTVGNHLSVHPANGTHHGAGGSFLW